MSQGHLHFCLVCLFTSICLLVFTSSSSLQNIMLFMDVYVGVLISFLCLPYMCMANVGIPVLLFKDARVETKINRPLAGHTISSDEFSRELSTIKNSDIVITFLQDELSREDFLRLGMNMKRGGLFKNVQKYSDMKTSISLPAVKAPEHQLQKLRLKYKYPVAKEARDVLGYLSENKLKKNTAILINLLPTSGEDSSAAINTNDELIGKVMSIAEQSGLTYTAAYTGKSHRKAHEVVVQKRFARKLLATDKDNITKYFFNETDCLLYIDSMKVKEKLIEKRPVVKCTFNGNMTEIKINDVSMEFERDNATSMWFLKSTKIKDTPVKSPDISAPLQFCYHCSTYVRFFIGNDSRPEFEFKTIQVQVFEFKEKEKFGYAYDCTPFFTIPLWTGLLTALFLITVTIYGLQMLSSIQTFDQYDDPKSKPLTVNISE